MNSSFAYCVPGLKKGKIIHRRDKRMPASTALVIKAEVLNYLQLDEKEFSSLRSSRRICDARSIFFKIMRDKSYWTLTEIAQFTRPKKPFDHTTVMHAINVLTDLIQANDPIKQSYEEILEILNTKDLFL